MKPSLLAFLLLLSFLLQEAQGIRLEKGFMQVGQQKLVQEDHEKTSLKGIISTNGNVLRDVDILCKQGRYCTGMNDRKLITVTTSSSTTSKNEKNGGNNADPMSKDRSNNGEVGGEVENFTVNSSSNSDEQYQTSSPKDHYEEIMDLAEMDYSPARRKPPIHN